MPYDLTLADRVRVALADSGVAFEDKAMMGGLCFMVDGKMCLGVVDDLLMARLDPAIYEEALSRRGARPMDFTGRPMKGYVFVEPVGTKAAKDLASWTGLALEFNPRAKSSRKGVKKTGRKQ